MKKNHPAHDIAKLAREGASATYIFKRFGHSASVIEIIIKVAARKKAAAIDTFLTAEDEK